jgi:gliding motility-associated-like protein/uncharacterized repeat protein (TIGR01451 family)
MIMRHLCLVKKTHLRQITMKSKLILATAFALFSFSKADFAQAPALGTSANFVLFSTVGAVSNTGITHLTGNVGTNSGSSTGFGNVDGQMHDNDGVSAQCSADLLIAYNQLNADVPAFFPASLLGNGQILVPGIYSIPAAATLNLDLILDGQNNPNAVFIFQIQGPFSANANSKIKLINQALACNVFWKIEGLVSLATGTTMRGTVIANNAAITMSTGDTLEGRAMSIAGAITVDGILAYTPLGCGSSVLTGPIAPTLLSTSCFTLFTAIGPTTNVGITHVIGDVGSDNGLTTGFNPLFVTGMIHPVPDGATAQCATDLTTVYNYLNLLPYDIELLYPAQFGNNLVLTPHTYLMNSACTFTDTLYLNAEGNPNAVFFIHINGALSTSVYSKVNLINGAQSKNVFWEVNGAVTINDYSIFRGTIICDNGAMSLNTGVMLDGRALTTTGALNTSAIDAIMPLGCGSVGPPIITIDPANQTVCLGDSVSFIVVATGTNLTYQWRKGNVNLVNAGNISGVTTDTLTINPVTLSDAAPDYNCIITGTYSPNDTTPDVVLVVNTPPSITTQPVNQIVCSGDSTGFSVTATGTGLTYQWRKGIVNLINAGNISGATSSTLVINPAGISDAATDYNVVVSGACPPALTLPNVSLTVNPSPTANAGSNSPVCTNDTIFLTAQTVVGATYSWTGPNGFTSALQNPVILLSTAADAGTYSLVVTNNGCNSASSFVNVMVNNCIADLNIVKTVNDTIPVFRHQVVFTIVVTNNGPVTATGVAVTEVLQSGFTYVSSSATTGTYDPLTGVWTIGTLLNGATATLTITATVIENGNYVNTVVVYGNEPDNNLADNNSSVEVHPWDFFIPEGFSPNGDGINDLFVIRGIDHFPGNTFMIFNRWGNKVFEASPYTNTWDGQSGMGMTIGGNDLPVGTYFYVLDLGDGTPVYKGTIYLNK